MGEDNNTFAIDSLQETIPGGIGVSRERFSELHKALLQAFHSDEVKSFLQAMKKACEIAQVTSAQEQAMLFFIGGEIKTEAECDEKVIHQLGGIVGLLASIGHLMKENLQLSGSNDLDDLIGLMKSKTIVVSDPEQAKKIIDTLGDLSQMDEKTKQVKN